MTLQVYLRLQWVRQLVRGQYMNAEIDLAGIGMIVMGGLQDELFNLTLDRLKVNLVTLMVVTFSSRIQSLDGMKLVAAIVALCRFASESA